MRKAESSELNSDPRHRGPPSISAPLCQQSAAASKSCLCFVSTTDLISLPGPRPCLTHDHVPFSSQELLALARAQRKLSRPAPSTHTLPGVATPAHTTSTEFTLSAGSTPLTLPSVRQVHAERSLQVDRQRAMHPCSQG